MVRHYKNMCIFAESKFKGLWYITREMLDTSM